MKNEVGLWLDHRQAVIVMNLDQQEEVKRITSQMEKHVRYSGASPDSGGEEAHHDTTEDGRDRRFDDELNRYYDEVISYLRDATSILILGPGEAKGELQKRLAGREFSGTIVAVETADKMTDHQIAAAVRRHFGATQHRANRAASEQPTS